MEFLGFTRPGLEATQKDYKRKRLVCKVKIQDIIALHLPG